ncbi:hypothetical protein C7445_10851 [Alicyclobacillus sacchari]|uniref:Uncharacterized protein n=1 Tax=Alicyclobacillus sacchari TaxID=392010 RepID=A0A4R8LN66_9BACL|nr:hypothetical protein C7445_10851 [Alicyclobacillus sacchari]
MNPNTKSWHHGAVRNRSFSISIFFNVARQKQKNFLPHSNDPTKGDVVQDEGQGGKLDVVAIQFV